MGGSTMFKWLLATVAGAAITAGAVYVAQHPELLEGSAAKSSAQSEDNREQEAFSETLSGRPGAQEQAKGAEPDGSKAVIDRLIKKPKREPVVEAKVETDAELESDDVTATETISEQVVVDTTVETIAVETVVVDTTPMPVDGEETDAGDVDSYDIEISSTGDETLIDIEQELVVPEAEIPSERVDSTLTRDMDNRPEPSEKLMLVDQILAQAEQIDNPDLRDQAYLDLVDYSVRESNFDMAKLAMTKMQQIELRDNARGRIAEAYARAGDSDSAFAMIDDVEIEEFRDFTRLRVIQAFIVKPQQR